MSCSCHTERRCTDELKAQFIHSKFSQAEWDVAVVKEQDQQTFRLRSSSYNLFLKKGRGKLHKQGRDMIGYQNVMYRAYVIFSG